MKPTRVLPCWQPVCLCALLLGLGALVLADTDIVLGRYPNAAPNSPERAPDPGLADPAKEHL